MTETATSMRQGIWWEYSGIANTETMIGIDDKMTKNGQMIIKAFQVFFKLRICAHDKLNSTANDFKGQKSMSIKENVKLNMWI